ncbi:MAG TPA: flagellar hook-associated protein FlgK [Halanaerobiales bacterium]|nr:flagellar hook-associated protein FlgK [Halanaerobiales bacterium]
MVNYFNGINLGYKALTAQKTSLDVIGHNISNANTEGYSRQRAVHNASNPYPIPGLNTPAGPGQMGTGVEIEKIERIKSEFIEQQIRGESQKQGFWNKLSEGLRRIETILNEPSETSLNNALESFWESLQDLGNNPEDVAIRETVKESAITLTDTFFTLYKQLDDYQSSLNRDVSATVDKVNSLSSRIADLNRQIVSIRGSGMEPNDLLDKRDLLFGELSQLVDVQGKVDSRGNLNVSVGGMVLVAGTDVFELAVEPSEVPKEYKDTVVFARTGEEVLIQGGELAGIIETRDEAINHYKARLNKLSAGLAEGFNEFHREGYDLNGDPGEDFFIIDENYDNQAQGLRVSEEIRTNPDKIAAGNYSDNPTVVMAENVSALVDDYYTISVSVGTGTEDFDYTVSDIDGNLITSGSANALEEVDLTSAIGINIYLRSTGEANISFLGNPGSGDNATFLADFLKNGEAINGISVTSYFEATVSNIGVEGQRAEHMTDNQRVVLEQLENQREAYSGVSLDEEMANMIKFHQAYNAAARIITTTDTLLDTLINMTR